MDMLLEIQTDFARALLDSGRAVPPSVACLSGVPSLKRFSVYRNNVIVSLTEVLAAYFPVVARLVGEEFFRATARKFIVEQPPRSPILSRYGAEFADFLERFEPVSDVPYLADIARLEWLQQRAYHAADTTPLTAHDVAAIPPHKIAELRLHFHPSARVLVSAYPVFSIWRTNTFDEHVSPIGLEAEGESALISRASLEVRTLGLSRASAVFVEMLMAGAVLGEAASNSLDGFRDYNLQWTIKALIDMGAVVDATVHRAATREPLEMNWTSQ